MLRSEDEFWLWRGGQDVSANYEEDKNSVSVFVGICESEERFEAYWDDKALGYDFGFFCDEDFAIIKFREPPLQQIDALFDDAGLFDLAELKKQYPDGLDRPYNAVYVIGSLNYKGTVSEFENEDYEYFKFLGVFPAKKW